jgi:hypothetical protein
MTLDQKALKTHQARAQRASFASTLADSKESMEQTVLRA